MTEKKIILFGAGAVGQKGLNYLKPERVRCFADNSKAGQTFCGKPVISFIELTKIHADYDVVLSVGAVLRPEIGEQLGKAGIAFKHLNDVLTHDDFESNPEIARFKDTQKGKRCFLIGNGPSLKADDLTTLHEHGEICFACNAISKIFSQTLWRPKYFLVSDTAFLLESEMLVKTEAEHKFIRNIPDTFSNQKWDAAGVKKTLIESGGFIEYITIDGPSEVKRFSPDPSKAVYSCGTVMYVMMQLSVYMGFNELYLLGVDGGTASEQNLNEFLAEKHHFYEENMNIAYQRNKFFPRFSKTEIKYYVEKGYIKAEEYTRARGIKILNATRGGTLETFERVDFDSIF